MVTRTRFRDVPFEEVVDCMGGDSAYGRDFWNRHRGKPVDIDTPARTDTENFRARGCLGPFFKMTGTPYNLCPQLAEIGD